MANLQYSSDIIDYVLFEGGEKTDGTSDYDAQVLRYLNLNYKKILQGGSEFDPDINEDWVWLRAEGNLILQAKISTGTVSVTNNSATATLSASQSTDVTGWFFKVDSYEGIFKVSAHSAPSDTLTLDSVYTGDTSATASYKLIKLDYTIASDAVEVLSPMRTAHRNNGRRGIINVVQQNSLPLPHELIAGVPYLATQTDTTTIRFNRYPDTDMYRIDYRYKKLPADLTDSGSEEPLVPYRHRHVLANMCLFDLLKVKNDDRAEVVSLQAKAGLRSMAIENRVRMSQMDGTFGKIWPRAEDRLEEYEYQGEPYT